MKTMQFIIMNIFFAHLNVICLDSRLGQNYMKTQKASLGKESTNYKEMEVFRYFLLAKQKWEHIFTEKK